MGYGDELHDTRSQLFWQVVESFTTTPDIAAFEAWKKIVVHQFEMYGADHHHPSGGLFCLAILDDLLLLDPNLPQHASADQLAGFMRIHANFRDYCVLLVEGDGLLGEIKFGFRLDHAAEVIKAAIELSA